MSSSEHGGLRILSSGVAAVELLALVLVQELLALKREQCILGETPTVCGHGSWLWSSRVTFHNLSRDSAKHLVSSNKFFSASASPSGFC